MGMISFIRDMILGMPPKQIQDSRYGIRHTSPLGECWCPFCRGSSEYDNNVLEDYEIFDGSLGAKIFAINLIRGTINIDGVRHV